MGLGLLISECVIFHNILTRLSLQCKRADVSESSTALKIGECKVTSLRYDNIVYKIVKHTTLGSLHISNSIIKVKKMCECLVISAKKFKSAEMELLEQDGSRKILEEYICDGNPPEYVYLIPSEEKHKIPAHSSSKQSYHSPHILKRVVGQLGKFTNMCKLNKFPGIRNLPFCKSAEHQDSTQNFANQDNSDKSASNKNSSDVYDWYHGKRTLRKNSSLRLPKSANSGKDVLVYLL